jgi:hypothetical protein
MVLLLIFASDINCVPTVFILALAAAVFIETGFNIFAIFRRQRQKLVVKDSLQEWKGLLKFISISPPITPR